MPIFPYLDQIQKKSNAVQSQRQGQIPIGASARKQSQYGLHQKENSANLKNDCQNIQTSHLFAERQDKKTFFYSLFSFFAFTACIRLFFTAVADHMVAVNPIGNDKIKNIDT